MIPRRHSDMKTFTVPNNNRRSTLLTLRGGVQQQQGDVAHSSFSSVLSWIPRATGDAASFAVPCMALILVCFGMELRLRLLHQRRRSNIIMRNTGSDCCKSPKAAAEAVVTTNDESWKQRVRLNLREHRYEKWQVLQKMTPRVLTLALTIPWLTNQWRLAGGGTLTSSSVGAAVMPWDEAFWSVAPTARQMGMWMTHATLMIVIDSSTDECDPYCPKGTLALAVLADLFLVYKLATAKGGGHLAFTMDAVTVLISTFLGGTIDTIAWVILGSVAVTLLVTSAVLGWLPSIPDGVSGHGVVAYLILRLGSASLYQMLQNVSASSSSLGGKHFVPQIHLYRDLLSLVAVAAGTPVSWILKDFFVQIMAFTLKIVVDTVALTSLL